MVKMTRSLFILCLVAGVAYAQNNRLFFGSNNFGGGFGGGFGSGFGSGFGGNYQQSSSGSCRYWCRTPQGQAYCCEGGNQIQTPVNYPKPGYCPPVRPQCPPVRNFRPPSQCSQDSRCPGNEKCCFDTCLQHHTCKPPQGGFFG